MNSTMRSCTGRCRRRLANRAAILSVFGADIKAKHAGIDFSGSNQRGRNPIFPVLTAENTLRNVPHPIYWQTDRQLQAGEVAVQGIGEGFPIALAER